MNSPLAKHITTARALASHLHNAAASRLAAAAQTGRTDPKRAAKLRSKAAADASHAEAIEALCTHVEEL